LEGRYHKSLASVIAANNEDEGGYFLPSPENVTIDVFNTFLSFLVPNMTSAGQDAARAMYLDPTSQESIWESTTALISDVRFTCNAQVVASSYAAQSDSAFRYIFAVPPAEHSDDVVYSFYGYGNSPGDVLVANTSVATVLSQIISSLAVSGIPEYAPNQLLEKYGVEENILVVNVTASTERAGDPWHSERCTFWQKADYVQS